MDTSELGLVLFVWHFQMQVYMPKTIIQERLSMPGACEKELKTR